MGVMDLDARRREAGAEPHQLTVGGHTYDLPAKLPLVVAELLIQSRVTEACAVLVGDDHAARLAGVLSFDETNEVLGELYGVTATG